MSERNGSGNGTGAAVGGEAVTAGSTNGQGEWRDDTDPGDPAQPDSWFEPAGRRDSGESPVAEANGAGSDVGTRPTDWFLRAGRAGLLPDSMTVDWDAAESATVGQESVGAPPWARESVAAGGTPPPWESGPWPGPGDQGQPLSDAALQAGDVGPAKPSEAGSALAPAQAGNWQARAAVAAGIFPLVLPGLVFGVLGLRQARASGVGRVPSWLGMAFSVAWAVVLIVVIGGSSGASSSGCGVPVRVRSAYTLAMKGFSEHVSDAVLAADLRQAASEANSAAAAANQVSARDALFAAAGDLQQAQADVAAQRAVPASLHQRLVADGAALAHGCSG